MKSYSSINYKAMETPKKKITSLEELFALPENEQKIILGNILGSRTKLGYVTVLKIDPISELVTYKTGSTSPNDLPIIWLLKPKMTHMERLDSAQAARNKMEALFKINIGEKK